MSRKSSKSRMGMNEKGEGRILTENGPSAGVAKGQARLPPKSGPNRKCLINSIDNELNCPLLLQESHKGSSSRNGIYLTDLDDIFDYHQVFLVTDLSEHRSTALGAGEFNLFHRKDLSLFSRIYGISLRCQCRFSIFRTLRST